MRISRITAYVLWTALLCGASGGVQAQVGDNAAALPGIVRVGVPSVEPRLLALSGSAGYGVTESQQHEGAHHRLNGSLAASVGLARFLAVGLRFDGRYDAHPADAMGADDGWVGDPRAYARASTALSDSLRFGGELLVWLPGNSAPSLVPKATSLDLKSLLGWSNHHGLELAALVGFRWDNSGSSAPNSAMLRAGDRLALAVSDFDAVLLGVGASQRLGKVEILGELSADPLLGSGAPSFLRSPIRASMGARYHATGQLACELLLDTSLSERPTLSRTSADIPIEPRVSVQLGLRYAFTGKEKQTAPVQHAIARPVSLEPAVVNATLNGRVVDEDGAAVEGATIRVRIADTTREAHSASDGSYQLTDLPRGKGQLTLQGDGIEETAQAVEIGAARAELELHAKHSAPVGQIRGLVRAFDGTGLAASIEVKEQGLHVNADAQGKFELDVPPGNYDVVIEMPGFSGQQRAVTVEVNGVTLLNVELRRQER